MGKPLASVEVRIRNPNNEGVGEIVARTPTATSGYLGDPTPICDEEGWVLSGDLGRFDEEGFLYVVGRSKDTIIRGGENIAWAHVESWLRTHPQVLEAAVVPLPHADLGGEVCAAVVLRPGAEVTTEELRAHAAGHLARFEIPSRWWFRYDPLPTNASGKVTAIGREALASDPHFKTNADRLQHRKQLDEQLAAAIAEDTLEGWTSRLAEANVLFAPVRNFEEVFSDRVVRDAIVQTVPHPTRNPLALKRHRLRATRFRNDANVGL